MYRMPSSASDRSGFYQAHSWNPDLWFNTDTMQGKRRWGVCGFVNRCVKDSESIENEQESKRKVAMATKTVEVYKVVALFEKNGQN